jgi:hypothetical protein
MQQNSFRGAGCWQRMVIGMLILVGCGWFSVASAQVTNPILYGPTFGQPGSQSRTLSQVLGTFGTTTGLVDVHQLTTRSQRLLAVSLQGLANRSGSLLYLQSGSNAPVDWIYRDVYARYMRARPVWMTLDTALARYLGVARPTGYVIYDPNREFTITIAENMAGAERLLIVGPEDAERLNRLGLSVKYDLRTLFTAGTPAAQYHQALAWVYARYWPQKSRTQLAHLHFGVTQDRARDYVIQTNTLSFWLPGGTTLRDDGKETPDPLYSDDTQRLIEYIMHHAPANIPVLGFWPAGTEGYDEYHGVKLAGQFGKFTLVTDHVGNYSFHSRVRPAGYRFNSRTQQTVTQRAISVSRTIDPRKKYIALVMIESGDSPGYIQSGLNLRQWSDAARSRVPLSIGITPSVNSLIPTVLPYLYSTAGTSTYIFSAVTGLGYMYPFLNYGEFGVLNGQHQLVKNQTTIMREYFTRTNQELRRWDMSMMGLYSDLAGAPWRADHHGRILGRDIAPNLPNVVSVIADMGALANTKGAQANYLIPGTLTSVHHTQNMWDVNLPADSDIQALATGNDQMFVDRLKTAVRDAAATTQFAQVMFYSWHYGPRRLEQVVTQLRSEGYEFVTLDEFDCLWRVGTGVPLHSLQTGWCRPTMEVPVLTATATGIWQNDQSGTLTPAQAIDGNLTTRWASNDDNRPVALTLQYAAPVHVSGATTTWEFVAEGDYVIEVSLDGVTYTTVATRKVTSNSTDVVSFAETAPVRFVRIRATGSGHTYRSLYEVSLRVRTAQ